MTIEQRPSAGIMTIDKAMLLAVQLQGEGQLARAEDILNRILHAQPNYAHALHLLGVIAHQVGKTLLAIQLIQQAVKSDATVALFHSNLGEMHRQLRALDLSIACGQCAIKLDPYSAEAWSNLGVAYYDTKNYEQAEACHQRALAINPQQCNSLNNLGSVHKERKNSEEAMRYYRAAMSLSPNYTDPLNNLGAMLVTEQQYNEAIELLNRAITLSPTFADAHCNLGFAHHGLDNDDIALQHFQRALQLKPIYAEAYIGLSKLHRARSDFEAAERYARQAIDIDPSNADFYQCLAEIYSEQGATKLALTYFDQAISLDPTSNSLQVSKGNLLLELGEADTAEALLSSATTDHLQATQLSAHCSLVQLRTVKKNDPSMLALLAILNKRNQLSPKQQEYLYFGLGKCYDDIGDWSTAFEYYTQGCQHKRSRINYSSDEQTQFALRITKCFSEETIQRLRASANSSTLPIFVVGMPRSGTTLVEQIIASHPDVYGAGELLHLSNIAHRLVEGVNGAQGYPENVFYLTESTCHAMTEEYLTNLQRYAPTFSRITDKMPGNFVLIGLIHTLFPHAKIIHVERNPIDTCLSCYTKLFRQGQFFSYDLTELAHFYANYRQIMAHWRRVLPVGAWLDVNYEKIVSDLEAEARKLIDYCDLDWNPACLDFHTTKRQVRTASLMQVRKPIYTSSVERWRRFESELAPLIKILTQKSCI